MTEHRVPMLGDALRRRTDPARSTDPRVRRLVTALGTLELAPAPSDEFRAELRAQLVAVTPRLVVDGGAAPAAKQPADAGRDRFRLRRPLIVTACLLTALVVLLGGAVWLSRSALPGDVLYGLKRASEDTELALAGSTADKGKLKLEFAANRIDEVGALLPGAGALALGAGTLADGGLSEHTAGLVRQTLTSADDDIRAAAQLLGTAAVHSGSPGTLDAIIAWAPPQLRAMRVIAARLPTGAALSAANATRQLIRVARARAVALEADLGCGCLDRTGSDALGPQPCRHPCAGPRTPGGRGPSSGPSSASSASTRRPSGRPGPTGPAGPGTTEPSVSKHPGTYPASTGRPGEPRGSSAPPAGPRSPTRPGPGRPTGRGTSPAGTPPASTRGGGGPPGTPTSTPTKHPTRPTSSVPGASTVPTPTGSLGSCGLTLGLGPIGIGIGLC